MAATGSTPSGFPIPRPPVLADMRARTDSRCPARPPPLLELASLTAVVTSARPFQGPSWTSWVLVLWQVIQGQCMFHVENIGIICVGSIILGEYHVLSLTGSHNEESKWSGQDQH